MRPPLTTHVLDTARGRPAAGLPITLEQRRGESWARLGEAVTNADGRVDGDLTGGSFAPGVYRLRFETSRYFETIGVEGFYPYAEIVFEVRDASEHHHVPLLLSPFGYSTYRGS